MCNKRKDYFLRLYNYLIYFSVFLEEGYYVLLHQTG